MPINLDAVALARPINQTVDRFHNELVYRGFMGCSVGAATGVLYLYVSQAGIYEILKNEYPTYNGHQVLTIYTGAGGFVGQLDSTGPIYHNFEFR